MSDRKLLIKKVSRAPKAELHVHIEGTLEPETMFQMAKRNGVTLKYASVESLRSSYDFSDLQSFLDIYYTGTSVLLHEQDFYQMTREYLEHALADSVIHTEIFFDPQSHLSRGVGFDIFMPGMLRALEEMEKHNISASLILCFLRHLPEEDALAVFEMARPWFARYPNILIGVGLDSSEKGHPPSKFSRVFALAAKEGLHCVAHAGEEGPAEYIAEALDILQAERIDHGVRCLESKEVVERLRTSKIPLTVCPLSNVKLKVFDTTDKHNLKHLLDANLRVTVNSDDPAYFGGYINSNFQAMIEALNLDESDCYSLLRNSLESAFVSEERRNIMLEKLRSYWNSNAIM